MTYTKDMNLFFVLLCFPQLEFYTKNYFRISWLQNIRKDRQGIQETQHQNSPQAHPDAVKCPVHQKEIGCIIAGLRVNYSSP